MQNHTVPFGNVVLCVNACIRTDQTHENIAMPCSRCTWHCTVLHVAVWCVQKLNRADSCLLFVQLSAVVYAALYRSIYFTWMWTLMYILCVTISLHVCVMLCGTVWCRLSSCWHIHCGHVQYCTQCEWGYEKLWAVSRWKYFLNSLKAVILPSWWWQWWWCNVSVHRCLNGCL